MILFISNVCVAVFTALGFSEGRNEPLVQFIYVNILPQQSKFFNRPRCKVENEFSTLKGAPNGKRLVIQAVEKLQKLSVVRKRTTILRRIPQLRKA